MKLVIELIFFTALNKIYKIHVICTIRYYEMHVLNNI